MTEHEWSARAAQLIPGGSSTGSKRPAALYGEHNPAQWLPTHYTRADGCHLWLSSGQRLLDLGMALGAVGLGYADPEVTEAVKHAAASGPVSSLPHHMEIEVAELLVEVLPCAERVRFLKTGAEAGAAALRIARTLTGRTRVIACGYFGWLDWNNDAAGVPESMREAVTWVPFNDAAALRAALAEGDAPAAIMLEPLVHELASVEWLREARRLADNSGAVLVYDEVKTAFRVRSGGVQALHGVLPDLATVGKALANGYPLAAVAGRSSVMEAASRTWISSTAACETVSLAAARTVLLRHMREDVCAAMAAAGERLKSVTSSALALKPRCGVQALGPSVMWRLVSQEPEDLDTLVRTAVRDGILYKRGAYQFGALAHDDAAVSELEERLPGILNEAFPEP